MSLDTDIQSFPEYNSNCTIENTRFGQMLPLVANSNLSASDTNKIVVRRSGAWLVEGEEAYNGHIQDFGNISGSFIMGMDGHSCRSAMLATITGDTFITGFGSNFSTGVVYHLFLKQDAVGGHSVRWPYGASVLNMVRSGPEEITEVYIIKLPNGKTFIKCVAFQNTQDVGFVLKEFENPIVNYPNTTLIPFSFIWQKASQLSYGGTLSGLYSDWEIAEDSLYTNLLFSSYGNTVDLYQIAVVLSYSGTVYMRTRYGGNIGGTDVVSSWTQLSATVESGGELTIKRDLYWDKVIYYLPLDGYVGSKNIINMKDNGKFSISSSFIFIDSGSGPQEEVSFVRRTSGANATTQSIVCPHAPIQNLGNADFCIEFFFRWDSSPSTGISSPGFFGKRGFSDNISYTLYFYNNTITFVFTTNGTSQQFFTINFTPTVGLWYHFAVYRNGSNLNLAINGQVNVLTSSFLSTIFSGNAPLSILSDGQNNVSGSFSMSHFRFTKGYGRYPNSNFDVPEVPFGIANEWWVPNPKPLGEYRFLDTHNWDKVECLINGYGLADSTSFKDDSGKSLVVFGNTKIDVTQNVSSILFDGNGDYISIGNTGDFNFLHNGLHPWTIEFWFKPSAVNISDTIFDTCRFSANNIGVFLGFSGSSGQMRCLISNGNGSTGVLDKNFFEYTFQNDVLCHVAFVYDHSLVLDNLKMFVNGVLSGSATKTGNAPNINNHSGPAFLGAYSNSNPSDMFHGTIYAIRISRMVRYTSSFSVNSNTPYFVSKPVVENWFNTKILINSLGLPSLSTDIRDYKGSQISVFGNTAIGLEGGFEFIDFGSGDYLTSSFLSLGTDPFTLEFYASCKVSGGFVIFDSRTGDFDPSGFTLYFHSSGKITFGFSDGTLWYTRSSQTTYSLGTIYRITISRVDSTNLVLLINGVVENNFTCSNNFIRTSCRFGANWNGAPSMTGRIYSIRLVSGVCLLRYNFFCDLSSPYFPYVNPVSDLWVDANDYSKITLGTGISEIKDKSFNDRTLSQPTTNSQPSLVQNHQNGMMAINFDGTDDFLAIQEFPQKIGNFILFVLDSNNIQTGVRTLLNRVIGVQPYPPALYIGGLQDYRPSVFWGTSYHGTSSVNCVGRHILCFHILSNRVDIYLNGVIVGQSSHSETVLTSWNCLNSGIAGTQVGNFAVNELLVGQGFSGSFISKLIGYAAHKWNLLGSMPENFPYKYNYPLDTKIPDIHWNKVALCLNANDCPSFLEVLDSKNMNKIYRYGDTSIMYENNKAYINFDGSGDYLSLSNKNGAASFGSLNFTIDFFLDISSGGSGSVVSGWHNASGGLLWYVYMGTDNTWSFIYSTNGSNGFLVTTPVSSNVRGKISRYTLTRSGNNLLMFEDGIIVKTQNFSGISIFESSSVMVDVGRNFAGTQYYLTGKLYSLRIDKDLARKAENFDPELSFPYFPNKE